MNKLFTFMRESSIARFLIPVGLILITFGIFVLIINLNNQNYIKIESTVVDIKEEEDIITDGDGNHTTITYDVTVNYTVDGTEYTGTLDNVSKHKVGDKMDIYYNPDDPNQITETKSLILPVVIIALGAASFSSGIVSAVNAVKRHKQMKEQERSWANE
ncbi:MAG: DUF3592 domain-containing protein [Bacilli bacterium]|nr:DUF3592 domain-containing protein [Bacilli bacterium]